MFVFLRGIIEANSNWGITTHSYSPRSFKYPTRHLTTIVFLKNRQTFCFYDGNIKPTERRKATYTTANATENWLCPKTFDFSYHAGNGISMFTILLFLNGQKCLHLSKNKTCNTFSRDSAFVSSLSSQVWWTNVSQDTITQSSELRSQASKLGIIYTHKPSEQTIRSPFSLNF